MDELEQLLEEIRSRHGYDFRGYAPEHLRRRLAAALARSGLGSLESFRQRIVADPDFFASVRDDFFVRVSEMFRDPETYAAIRTRLLPILRTYPLIRVWHCGCARGEEAYSTAILFREEGLEDRVQIYATDVNPGALEEARAGIYPISSLEKFARNYADAGGTRRFDDYFTSGYDGIALHESLRRNMIFFQHDLVSDHVFGEMHLVFCRNVLIYFGRELRDVALGKLTASLCPGGFLCLGSAEGGALDHRSIGLESYSRGDRIFRRSGLESS